MSKKTRGNLLVGHKWVNRKCIFTRMFGNKVDINEKGGLRNAAYISFLLMVVLLIGSIVFYKERLLFSDATHNLFRIINYNSLQVEAQRYGLSITQIFPLVGARLHLSLTTLMLLYSVSFYLFYTSTVFVLVFYFKEYALAILYGLYMTIFVSDAYYYLNNEGIALLFLAFAINARLASRSAPFFIALPVFVITSFYALWTHPLVMLPAIFLWIFLWVGRISWPYTKMQSWVYTFVLLVLSAIKYWYGKNHGYDSAKIEMITFFKPEKLLGLFSSPQFRFFAKNCVYDFWLFVVLFVVGVFMLLREKRYWLFLLTSCFVGGYMFLLFITYWDVDYNKFYLEIEYMPLAVISCTPFVYFIVAKMQKKRAIILVSAIFLVRMAYMLSVFPAFNGRIVMLEKINNKMAEKHLTKVIITPPSEEADKALIMNWGAPAESMIVSQLKGEQPQRAFIFMNEEQMKAFNTQSKDTLLGCFAKYADGNLNHYYFQLDTTSMYQVMSYTELMK